MPNDWSYIWESMVVRERESLETRCVELVSMCREGRAEIALARESPRCH
jgi:hypothetical protein